jgi:hypothetical protein
MYVVTESQKPDYINLFWPSIILIVLSIILYYAIKGWMNNSVYCTMLLNVIGQSEHSLLPSFLYKVLVFFSKIKLVYLTL